MLLAYSGSQSLTTPDKIPGFEIQKLVNDKSHAWIDGSLIIEENTTFFFPLFLFPGYRCEVNGKNICWVGKVWSMGLL